MATMTMKKNSEIRRSPVPRALRARVEALLQENYAFMDSESFRERGIEKQLFDFEVEPALPMTAWYQPTREDVADQLKGTPQLMKTPEERRVDLLEMILRNNPELTPEEAQATLDSIF